MSSIQDDQENAVGNILVDDDFNITGIIDWSAVQALPIEIFAANDQFRTYPMASAERNMQIIKFRSAVADEMCRLATQAQDSLGVAIAGFIGTTRAQLASLLALSHPWMLMVDARMRVLPLVRGKNAKWEDIEGSILASPISAELEVPTPASDIERDIDKEHDDKPNDSFRRKRCHSDSST